MRIGYSAAGPSSWQITINETGLFHKSSEDDLWTALFYSGRYSESRNLDADSEGGTSVYLHRLVVNRDRPEKGLGRELMQWIEQGIRFAGKDRIRLDCIAGNAKLSQFYKQCGYTHMGETDGFNIS